MKRTLKAALAVMLALIMVLGIVPVSANNGNTVTAEAKVTSAELKTAERAVEITWTVPAGYNEHDYNKCAAYLEQIGVDGSKNGENLSESYDPNDPSTWHSDWADDWDAAPFVWESDLNELRIAEINLGDTGALYGTLDVSGCEYLQSILVWCGQLTAINASGCLALHTLNCDMNDISSLDVTNCTALTLLSCFENPLSELDLSTNPALPYDHILAEGPGFIAYSYNGCDLEFMRLYAHVLYYDYPMIEFEGFFDEEGNLISAGICYDEGWDDGNYSIMRDSLNNRNGEWDEDEGDSYLYETYYCIIEPDQTGAVIARFSEPSWYNDHDFHKVVDFLETEDENGVKNGEKINPNYDPSDPLTWCAEEDTNGFYFEYDSYLEYAMDEISLMAVMLGSLDLCGNLDLSGCEYLRDLEIECIGNRLSSIDLSGTRIDRSIVADGAGYVGLGNYEDELHVGYYVHAQPISVGGFRGFYNGDGEQLQPSDDSEYTYVFYSQYDSYPDDYDPDYDHVIIARFSGNELPAPENVGYSIIAISGKPVIEWDAVAGAENYRILRKTDGGEYELICTTTETCYTDETELTLNATYYYKVNAVDANGEPGAFSAEIAVVPYILTKPEGVSVALVDCKPTVKWNAVPHAKGYEIWRKLKGGTYKLAGIVDGTTFTDEASLTPRKVYYYRVRAFNETNSLGYFSKEVSITSYGLKTPTGVKAKIVECKPIITWNAVPNANEYQIYRKIKGGTYAHVATVSGTSFIDESSLSALKTYYYKIRAIDDCTNKSEFSSAVSVVAYGLTPPTGVTAVLLDRTPLIVWNAAKYATGYEVWRMEKGGAYERIATVSELSFIDTAELNPLKTYYYRVRSIDDYGNIGNFSTPATVTTYGLSAPTNVSAIFYGSKPLITWNPVSYAVCYKVWRMAEGGEYELVSTVNVTNFFDNDALGAGTYYYKVIAIDGYGLESEFSSAVSIVMPG